MNLIISALISALTGLGIGSGGLLIIYLTFFLQFSQLKAQALNLMFFIVASFFCSIINIIKKRIKIKAFLIMGLVGVIFSLLGSYLATVTEERILRILFGCLLLSFSAYELILPLVKKKK